MQNKKILVFGLNAFQQSLVQYFVHSHTVIAVDYDDVILDRFGYENPDIETILGEASSIVTWKKIFTDEISHIITSIKDFEVTTEICRIAREIYKLEIPIIIISLVTEPSLLVQYEKYGVTLLNPTSIVIGEVENLIEKNYRKPANIGLGKGEIVEVNVLRRSHIVGRKMRYLQPNRWKIAGVYRGGKFIIPDADFSLQIGDRALLIGNPQAIEAIVSILTKGTPEFPLQYGQNFVVVTDKLREGDLPEIEYFNSKVKSRFLVYYKLKKQRNPMTEEIKELELHGGRAGDDDLRNFRSAAYIKDTGVLAVSVRGKFSMLNLRMRYLFKRCSYPFLICRGVYPYSEIVISLNGGIPERLLDIGVEVATLLSLPFKAIYVAPPEALRTGADDEELKRRQKLLTNFENLNRIKIDYYLLEGNPVKETLSIIGDKKDLLLVISADSKDPISIISPHVSYLLASLINSSVLVLPDEEIINE